MICMSSRMNESICFCVCVFTGSNSEKESIHAAYLEKNGNIKYILKRVPFLSEQDEPRVRLLIEGSKDFGESVFMIICN